MWFDVISKVSKFTILPYKIENSEILESFILLKFLVVYIRNSKSKKLPRRKTLRCGLRRKNAYFWRFPNFRFCTILEIKNLETSESFHLLQMVIVLVARLKPFIEFQFSRPHVLCLTSNK